MAPVFLFHSHQISPFFPPAFISLACQPPPWMEQSVPILPFDDGLTPPSTFQSLLLSHNSLKKMLSSNYVELLKCLYDKILLELYDENNLHFRIFHVACYFCKNICHYLFNDWSNFIKMKGFLKKQLFHKRG